MNSYNIGIGALFPIVAFLVWFGVLIYGIVLATRFVTAVERIAHALERRPPDRNHA